MRLLRINLPPPPSPPTLDNKSTTSSLPVRAKHVFVYLSSICSRTICSRSHAIRTVYVRTQPHIIRRCPHSYTTSENTVYCNRTHSAVANILSYANAPTHACTHPYTNARSLTHLSTQNPESPRLATSSLAPPATAAPPAPPSGCSRRWVEEEDVRERIPS